MERIIAGRFPMKQGADAAAALMADYVDATDMCIFHNNAPGQHDVVPEGGDVLVDKGSQGAGKTAAIAAIALGATAGTIGMLGGPAIAVAAAATGAYVGSLGGALNGLGTQEEVLKPRPAGIILAVHVRNPESDEARVIDAFKAEGAIDIERADGAWVDGSWKDFDPVAPPKLVTG